MKTPTQSPTHAEIELSRVAAMGLELEDLADGSPDLPLREIVQLAEDRGRPPSHYIAAIALATEIPIASGAKLALKICAGNCQQYGALDLIDHLVEKTPNLDTRLRLVPVS